MKLWKCIVVLVVLVAVNVLVQSVVCRWDMTDDKRYSISAPTKALLQELDAPLEVSILLDGDLNPGFQRLKKATYEMVEELGVYSGDNWKIKQLSNETIGLLEEEIREQFVFRGNVSNSSIARELESESVENSRKDKQHRQRYTRM